MENEITRLLADLNAGRPKAEKALFEAVYGELRKMAAGELLRLRPGQTLQTTALVHEAYLKLVGNTDPQWNGRGHFYAAAAQAMREIIVDDLRRKYTAKRGGGRANLPADAALQVSAEGVAIEDVLAVDEALDQLARAHPRQAKVVIMRYFGGLSEMEVADALGLTTRTVERDWRLARAYLHAQIAMGEE